MRKDLTDITVLLDRSGSMWDCQADAEGGLNSLIEEQKKQPGEALFTLIQFDNIYEVYCKATPIKEVGKQVLLPRGSTALLDSLGRAINETGERLAAMPEEERPGLVLFVIITDGKDNTPLHPNLEHTFTKQQIAEMTEHQQNVYKWQFTYLGANHDAFEEGRALGIAQIGIAQYEIGKTENVYLAANNKMSRMRGQTIAGQTVSNSFSDDELKSIK